MTLHLRNGANFYEIGVPEGSRLESTLAGSSALIIPGPAAGDTWSWLPAPSIVPAARKGDFGLRLLSERQLAAQRNRHMEVHRHAG
jgi:hypothetical protein